MTKDELIKLQKTQYEILKDLVYVLDKNNINYYLAYGTLLGAVRHQGSIPWDNDIDIFMTKEEYLKFRGGGYISSPKYTVIIMFFPMMQNIMPYQEYSRRIQNAITRPTAKERIRK